MQKWKYLAVSAALAAAPFVSAMPVHAASSSLDLTDGLSDVGEDTGLNTSQDLPDTIGTLIKIALGLLGIVFLLLTLYAGFLWMTAAGDSKQTEKARNILITAVVGLVILLSAYAISSFVITNIQTAVTSS